MRFFMKTLIWFFFLIPGVASASFLAEGEMLKLLRQEYGLTASAGFARVSDEQIQRADGRENLQVTLEADKVGRFRLLISGPHGFRFIDRAMPMVFVTTGFFAGTKPISLFTSPGAQVLIGFEYAEDPERLLARPQLLAEELKLAPARMYHALRWLEQQNWFQKNHLHVLAVSLGALFMPATTRLLEEDGMIFASHIYAFGGGSIRTPFENMVRRHLGQQETRAVATLVEAITWPLNPAIYLPGIRGPKMVIHADRDEVFPRTTQDELDDVLKGPKMTCRIRGIHVDLHRQHEVQLTLRLISAWVDSIHGQGRFPEIAESDAACVSSL